MFEQQDRDDPRACALREWHEEMGYSKPDFILGLLDDFYTISGLAITPVVAWFEAPPILEIAPQEVEEVFYFPLSCFSQSNLKKETIETKRSKI